MNSNLQDWLPLALTVSANMLLGFFIVVRRTDGMGRIFFLVTTSISGWIVTNYLADHSITIATSTDWTKTTFIFAIMIPLALALFSFNFPTQKKLTPWQNAALILPFFLIAYFLIFSHRIIDYSTPVNNIGVVTFGNAYLAYFFCFIVYLILAVTRLVISHLNSRGYVRSQTTYFLIGLVLASIFATLTNLILPLLFSIYEFTSFGGLATTLFIGFTAYAIIAFHLFDIRVFVSRAIIFTSLLGIIMAVYGLVINIITGFAQNLPVNSTVVSALITAAALSYTFEPLQQWIAERTDSWLFKKEYEQQEVTKKLSKQLANVIGLDEGLDAVMHTLIDTLHLHHAVTYVFQPGDFGRQIVKRSRQIGYSNPARLELTDHDFMIPYFTANPHTILLSDLEKKYEHDKHLVEGKEIPTKYLGAQELRTHAIRKVIIDKMKNLDVAVAIPLQLHTSSDTGEPQQ